MSKALISVAESVLGVTAESSEAQGTRDGPGGLT